MRRAWLWVVLPVLIALPVSLVMTYMALDHNAKGAYCTGVAALGDSNFIASGVPCRIRWDKAALVFGIWLFWQWVIVNLIRLIWFNRPTD